MSQAWDTTTAAYLRPDSPAFEYAMGRLRASDRIAFTASTLNEIAYGLHKAAARGRTAADRQLRWLRAQIAAGLVDILAFDERAAGIAGALRARMPTPPSAATQPRRRSKANDRVAWIMDLQTAATAFVHGYDLATADGHLPLIAEELTALAPTARPLLIHPPPRF
jgi:predicted nucleic acid-binding protein